jgi:hypothetical protein
MAGAGCELTGFQMSAITKTTIQLKAKRNSQQYRSNELIDGVTITPLCAAQLMLFNTAPLACSRSGKRRMDLHIVPSFSPIGLPLDDRGLRPTDQ